MNEQWSTVVEEFIAGRRSPQTRRMYALAIEKFERFLAQHHIGLAQATPRHVAEWIQSQHGIVASNTIYARLAALSALYDHAAKHVHPSPRSDNPTRAVAWPARQTPRRKARDRALDAERATQLLEQADVRAQALIALMAIEGLRCAEAVSLRWEDCDGSILIVVGKGGKRRFLQIADTTRSILLEWALEAGRRWGDPAPMFPGSRGKARISDRQAARIVRELGRAIGVDLSPHPLRATAISEWLAAGAQLHEAQRAAGHSSPATTEGYAIVAPPSASSKSRIGRKKGNAP